MMVALSSANSSSVQRSLMIDVGGIVEALVKSKKGPLNRVEAELEKKNISVSALAVFKSRVSAFYSAVKSLEDAGRFSGLAAGDTRNAAVTSALEDYVTTYNDLLAFYKVVSRPQSGSSKVEYQGSLLGDWASRAVIESISTYQAAGLLDSSLVSFSFYSIGVKRENDGQLAIDYTTLNSRISSLATKLAAGVDIGSTSSTTGLNTYLLGVLSAVGSIETSAYNVSNQILSLERQKLEYESRLQYTRESYTRQYATLDAQLAKMQSVSNSFSSFFTTFNRGRT